MTHDYSTSRDYTNYPPDSRGRPEHLPPPPMGEALHPRPTLKREESSRRSRLPPDTAPQFPDEASYLDSTAPDLERQNRPTDRAFRDRTDGYESDEGEMHRTMRDAERRRPRRDDDPRGPPPRRPRPPYPPGDSQLSGRRPGSYDDAALPPRGSRRGEYYEDEYLPPRRRDRDRPPSPLPEVEYGSDPIPARRRSGRRPPRRCDDYDDYSDDNDYRPPRRRRSFNGQHRSFSRHDDDRLSDDRDAPRRRRNHDDHGDRRRDHSRRRYHDDYDDDFDRRGRRDKSRDRRRESLPREIKIGGFDVGPWLQKGQKHWGTVAPIITPIVLNYARKHLAGAGGGGGGGRRY